MERTVETATPDQNPYAGPPEGNTPDRTAPKARQRFGAAAITGMVAATIGWALALLPLYVWADAFINFDYNLGFLINFTGFLGVITLPGSLIGFFTALRTGNRKLAARLYIIPSLAWQAFVVVLVVWLFVFLTFQNGF